ncbi:uncharacterized protein P174DRAFT_160684 [Aspergillus novofumigatus IBT 16806]|uniref:Uncharacterized protein n=1 Tax=Aspergillus novofumigatus (strain IBT 16806) TaxID=1392255 RepID=A0A2I1C814_ASPN1|nr:uncharacterized protein P174DRAFT_160684 [Aspergillus novofumigatus IBT 16806]PKX93767.1 hypothetical protein P174DRAFT_160684 [Aspergillus novofumigatus IBT 16806]
MNNDEFYLDYQAANSREASLRNQKRWKVPRQLVWPRGLSSGVAPRSTYSAESRRLKSTMSPWNQVFMADEWSNREDSCPSPTGEGHFLGKRTVSLRLASGMGVAQ